MAKKQTDFLLQLAGSITILYPKTPAAEEWIKDNVDSNAQQWCGGIAVEQRYIDDIVAGAKNDGLITKIGFP